MSREYTRIPFAEFASNPTTVFDRVVTGREGLVVENENGAAVLRPTGARNTSRRRRALSADEAFRAAAGGWKDVDTEELKRRIRESRRIPARPRVDL